MEDSAPAPLSWRYALLVCLALFTVVASGCAQFSKEECAIGDWRIQGADDGKRGLVKLDQFNKYAAVCRKKHGVELDSEAYFAGYGEGLPLYCSGSNGRALGGKGIVYEGVCTPALEPAFLTGYNKGLESFCTSGNGARLARQITEYNGVCPEDLQRGFLLGFVSGLEAVLSTLESDLFRLDREILDIESTLALDKIELQHQRAELARTSKKTGEYRKRKRIIDDITRNNRDLRTDIRKLEKRAKDLERDYDIARQQINTWQPLMRQ